LPWTGKQQQKITATTVISPKRLDFLVPLIPTVLQPPNISLLSRFYQNTQPKLSQNSKENISEMATNYLTITSGACQTKKCKNGLSEW
jgi:hypothetical protein